MKRNYHTKNYRVVRAVVKMLRKHPDWPVKQVANAAGCSASTAKEIITALEGGKNWTS